MKKLIGYLLISIPFVLLIIKTYNELGLVSLITLSFISVLIYYLICLGINLIEGK